MADEFWTLNRLGIQHTFILQPHLPLIKVGRATDQQLQCKGTLFYFFQILFYTIYLCYLSLKN